MQIIRNRKVFDVCVVGSGAGGGMAAKVLTEAGADVVMLEAGVMWDSARDAKMFAWSYDAPHRGAAVPSRQFGELDAGLGGWTLDGEPYTTGPDSRFDWFRTRMLGGRTNHWGRISLRFGPHDFERRTRDGLGHDWPISYDDLKPYYDEVDRLVGLFGSVENLPNEPDGIFLPPPRPRCYELLIKQSADALGITCIPSRLSILTRPHNGRKACHYCGQCGRGCAIHANFSSPSVLLPPALATGRLTLVTKAMAREVTTDESGLATGVAYIDTATGGAASRGSISSACAGSTRPWSRAPTRSRPPCWTTSRSLRRCWPSRVRDSATCHRRDLRRTSPPPCPSSRTAVPSSAASAISPRRDSGRRRWGWPTCTSWATGSSRRGRDAPPTP